MPSSSWRVILDPHAVRDLTQLKRQHHPVVPQIILAIDSLIHQPYAGKPLKGARRGIHSLRVGDFRVIYDLYPSDHAVHIIAVGDRKNIYR